MIQENNSEQRGNAKLRIGTVVSNKMDKTIVVLIKNKAMHPIYGKTLNQSTKVKEFVIDTLAPRSLDIEGLTNARDLGGYKTINGNYTKQGLIYRTSRLNENETTDNLITEQGILEMKNNLKIKSELDLRKVFA